MPLELLKKQQTAHRPAGPFGPIADSVVWATAPPQPRGSDLRPLRRGL